MGIWERLGNVIKSYLNDTADDFPRGGGGHSSGGSAGNSRGDPDLDAAYDELNDFLRGEDAGKSGGGKAREQQARREPPEELRKDFAELGLSPDASADECKEAYKKILKIYHPDRHTGNPGDLKKATEKTARVNAAYDRLEKWFKTVNNSS